ncbi:DUF397 domain-containing protein [Streptomyces sp. SAI-170]|uniref:DUF397 domain-containing protein n=1 Tax=Streptomyces sp. SAI-170 TaxID=3377729 RepID=UPI003C7A1C44
MSTAAPSGGLSAWRTSSYSNGAGGECVECAFTGDGTLVRDSKAVGRGAMSVGSAAWRVFVQAVKHTATPL